MHAITLEEAYYVAELVGALAVIASLVYLAVQLRQNNKMIRLSTLHDISSLYITCMLSVNHDQESTNLWIKGLSRYEELSPGEKARFLAFMGASMRTLAEQHYQWEQGALDSSTWEGMKALVDDFTQYPGFKVYWALRRHQFSASFRDHVEAAIGSAAVAARPMYV